MRVRFDPEADMLYKLVKEGPVKDTVEVAEDGSVAGVEVWRAREHVLGRLAEHVKAMIQTAT
ncbi:DUF2283 domain-containing protein [Candidatus Bathyarchaeota archaeon]|nr:DUF2283 domain-containing protein [Candidatus Bathyarchaeota archaeon]